MKLYRLSLVYKASNISINVKLLNILEKKLFITFIIKIAKLLFMFNKS